MIKNQNTSLCGAPARPTAPSPGRRPSAPPADLPGLLVGVLVAVVVALVVVVALMVVVALVVVVVVVVVVALVVVVVVVVAVALVAPAPFLGDGLDVRPSRVLEVVLVALELRREVLRVDGQTLAGGVADHEGAVVAGAGVELEARAGGLEPVHGLAILDDLAVVPVHQVPHAALQGVHGL